MIPLNTIQRLFEVSQEMKTMEEHFHKTSCNYELILDQLTKEITYPFVLTLIVSLSEIETLPDCIWVYHPLFVHSTILFTRSYLNLDNPKQSTIRISVYKISYSIDEKVILLRGILVDKSSSLLTDRDIVLTIPSVDILEKYLNSENILE